MKNSREAKPSKKKIILNTALNLFAKKGFQGTTFQLIADELGVTQPAIFIHFKDKMQLFAELRTLVAEHNRDYVDSKINIHDSALDSLKKHCIFNLEWVVKNPDKSQLIILLYHYACFDKQMKELNRQALEAGQERILKYILAATREHTLESKEHEGIVHDLQSFIIGRAILYISMKKPPSTQKIESDVVLFLEKRIKMLKL